MNTIRRVLVALALLVALAATPALADKPILQLEGTAGAFIPDPTGPTTFEYVFTNSGTGTLRGEQVTWTYEERGSADVGTMPPTQVVESGTYTIVQVKGKKEKTVVFDVVPSTYQVAYTGTTLCDGTFSARLTQGATVQGTFACNEAGVPSGSMEFTIERGSPAERMLAG